MVVPKLRDHFLDFTMTNWIPLLAVLCITSVLGDEVSLVIRPEGESQSQPAGKGFVLTCQGEADRPELFSSMGWLGPNGKNIPEGVGGPVEVSRTDDSSLVLVFKSPTTEDTGSYNCTAIYDNTRSLMSGVHLVFYQDITWENCEPRQPLVLGQEGRVHCRVSANPSATYTWTRAGQPLDSRRYAVDANGVAVATVGQEDAGDYLIKAMVTVTGRFQTRTIHVEVYVPPEITEIEESKEIVEGDRSVFACRASGYPEPKYYWFDANQRQLNGLEGYLVDEDQGSLTILSVKKEDRDTFTCMARNAAGEAKKGTDVTVIVRPEVTSFNNLTVEDNKETTFECRAQGEPLPQLSIRKEGQMQPYSDQDDRVILHRSVDGDQAVLKLTVERAVRSDDGLYYCVAENRGASVEKVGHLTVEYAPVMISTPSLLVKTWTGHPVNLTCVAESIPNATISWWFRGQEIRASDPPSGYVVYGTSAHSNLLVRPSTDFVAPGSPADVFGTYKCQSENKLGSDHINIELQEARTPGAILDTTVEKRTATTLTFRFHGPTDDGGLPVRAYIVQYREDGEPMATALKQEWSEGTPYIIESLRPRTAYRFQFAARNDVGLGQWSPEQPITTPEEAAPEAPKFITPGGNISRYHDRFEVRWTVPLDNGRPIDYFTLRYFPVDKWGSSYKAIGQDKILNIKDWQNAPRHELTGLQSNSLYKVEVRAHNDIGFSQDTYMVFRTAEGAGGPDEERLATSADGRVEEGGVSLAVIIIIILVLVAIILLAMDVVCFLRYEWGVLYALRLSVCARTGHKVKEAAVHVEDAKNGEELEEKSRTEVDNPAFDGKDKLQDNNVDSKNKSPKGSKSSIAKDSLV